MGGWETIVYAADGSVSDSPLPLALAKLIGSNNYFYHLLITIGLFGLIASFHGIVLAAGRASYEFGKVGFAPAALGKIQPKFRTPANALLVNMVIGIIALLTGKTAAIITISVFGALTLYIISMVAVLQLRKKEPALERPFKVPLYPLLPITALLIASFSFIAMCYFNSTLAIIYIAIMLACFTLFSFIKNKGKAPDNSNA